MTVSVWNQQPDKLWSLHPEGPPNTVYYYRTTRPENYMATKLTCASTTTTTTGTRYSGLRALTSSTCRMKQQEHSVNNIMSEEATVTIYLVTKAPTPLWSIHSVPLVVIPVQTRQHQHRNKRANPTCLLQGSVSILINSALGTFATMAITLKEQAWQSGLVLSDEIPEWNENDWPPLAGGWREDHASVVIDHPDKDKNNTIRRQMVVVLGGYKQGLGTTTSVLVLNLAQSNKQWRERPSMDKARYGHTAVVCNGGVYVMGGCSEDSCLNCIERIDFNDLLQSPLTTSNKHESHWTRLTCRLSTRRSGCCAVAVHNRYIVVMGGYNDGRSLSSVDIIDTRNHTVTAGPSMAVPRRFCTSAVIGHRIFVVGGCNESGNVDSVEYLDYATPCDNHETKEQTGSTFISFSPT